MPKAPLATETVRIKDAWLAFTRKGVPFIEPCLATAIVRGFNDQPRIGTRETDCDNDEDFKRWIWQRSCPGLDYTGSMPPFLEGVAYKMTQKDFERVQARLQVGQSLVRVRAVMFSSITGHESEEIEVYLPTFMNDANQEPGMQPTLRYLRLVLIGAHFSSLSQPFLGHLSLIRPFKPDLTVRKRFASWIMTSVMLPRYLFVHLPAVFLSRLSFWPRIVDKGAARLASAAETVETYFVRLVEKALSCAAGSGYRNEGEGGYP
ncbi:hypothetical protein OIV83_005335 [Microbotryomycetes sp. JL201]|nr:hypothetical protein OIV83_005335 [Microbotryomycetes sp. JL201]